MRSRRQCGFGRRRVQKVQGGMYVIIEYIYQEKQENPLPDHVLWKSPKDIPSTWTLRMQFLGISGILRSLVRWLLSRVGSRRWQRCVPFTVKREALPCRSQVDVTSVMGNEGRGLIRLLYPQVSMVMTERLQCSSVRQTDSQLHYLLTYITRKIQKLIKG